MFKNHLILLLIIVSSCAKGPVSNPKKPLHSNQIPKSVADIEKQKALNSYRLLRLESLKNKGTRRKYNKKPKTTNFLQISPKPIKKEIIPVYQKRNPEEMMVEINQNLTYFCMKQRKNTKFEEESSCQQFTKEKLQECQLKYTEPDNAKLVRCVKNKLRP